MMRSRLVLLAVFGALAAPLAVAQDASQEAIDRVGQKLQAILSHSVYPPSPATPLTTTFTEDEVNAYLGAQTELLIGIRQPRVLLLDDGRLDVRALVDLDAVRLAEERGWLDPLSYVSGLLDVQAVGVLRGTRGMGIYTFESARVGGAPVPRALLQELLAMYTRSPEMPAGVRLDTPFELPAGIREVALRRGLATVIQ